MKLNTTHSNFSDNLELKHWEPAFSLVQSTSRKFEIHAAIFVAALIATQNLALATTLDRWQLDSEQRAIVWNVAHDAHLPHADRIEIGGRRTAAILTYDISAQRELALTRTLIWPMLRIAPNDTSGFLKIDFTRDRPPCGREPLSSAGLDHFEPVVRVDGKVVVPKVSQVRYENGLLTITSSLGRGLQLTQTFTSGVKASGFFELWQIGAKSADGSCRVEITPLVYSALLPYRYLEKGVYHYGRPGAPSETRAGDYRISIDCNGDSVQVTKGMTGPICEAGIFYSAADEHETLPKPDFKQEIANRAAFAQARYADLRFECPDPVLETAFDFAKIRASDSICATQGGPMHAPGGGDYYAAIWANDTIEYVAPFYPFLGYDYGDEATLNAMNQWERYMNPQYRPLPSSIIAEGTDIWSPRIGPDGLPVAGGDRGDAAMLAYGCSRFLLAYGDRATALKHWPLIEWCLEYCNRQKTADGVIASAMDELEGRFPSGECNLNTSTLTYGGLCSAADLADELGKSDLARVYRERAEALHQAIRKYFEAEVQGFPTYQYYEGCQDLRAWICMPLTMGIFDRQQGSLAALFSPRLWTDGGILTAEGSTTVWDRATLYALRGAFAAGEPDEALGYLQKLSRSRLLGEHVPYMVEAHPEGNGRHLSAESALYCRIITEGLFGITPRGFYKFTIKPSLPSTWNHVALRNIKTFQSTFDIEVSRQTDGRLKILVTAAQAEAIEVVINAGETATVILPNTHKPTSLGQRLDNSSHSESFILRAIPQAKRETSI